MSPLIEFTTLELMDELKARSNGSIIALAPKCEGSGFITAFNHEYILETIGLHRIIKERIDIYLHDTTREYDDVDDDT